MTMKIMLMLLCFIFVSCNRIERGDQLNKEDINRIQQLGLLDPGEKIIKFYSEFKKQVAGNFFSNKRVAKYWIDEHNKTKNGISSAYYGDIISIDSIYNAAQRTALIYW